MTRFKLLRHQLIHGDRRIFQCLYCEKSFSRKDHLKNHLKVHDPNKELFQCKLCSKEYASSLAYRTHLAQHRAEKGELICGVCQELFTDKSNLLRHIKVHAGARSVKDGDEKTKQCIHCDKCFFTLKDVRRHMIVHTRQRDFMCHHCPQRFGRRDHLVRHLKKSHDKDVDPETLAPEEHTVEKVPVKKDNAFDSSNMISELLHSVNKYMANATEPVVKEEKRVVKSENTVTCDVSLGEPSLVTNTREPSLVTNTPSMPLTSTNLPLSGAASCTGTVDMISLAPSGMDHSQLPHEYSSEEKEQVYHQLVQAVTDSGGVVVSDLSQPLLTLQNSDLAVDANLSQTQMLAPIQMTAGQFAEILTVQPGNVQTISAAPQLFSVLNTNTPQSNIVQLSANTLSALGYNAQTDTVSVQPQPDHTKIEMAAYTTDNTPQQQTANALRGNQLINQLGDQIQEIEIKDCLQGLQLAATPATHITLPGLTTDPNNTTTVVMSYADALKLLGPLTEEK